MISPMRLSRSKIIITALAAIALCVISTLSACETKPAPEPTQVVQPTPAPTPPPAPVAPAPVATPEPATPALIYKVYEDETKPEQFVELTEFSTACTGMGDIFATAEVVINPKLTGELKVPLSRVVSITFGKLGLVEPNTIKGVGAINQPAGYRDADIVLKNPDEIFKGIVVICRDLKGKKTDGTDWAAHLKLETASKFFKIEISEAPK